MASANLYSIPKDYDSCRYDKENSEKRSLCALKDFKKCLF